MSVTPVTPGEHADFSDSESMHISGDASVDQVKRIANSLTSIEHLTQLSAAEQEAYSLRHRILMDQASGTMKQLMTTFWGVAFASIMLCIAQVWLVRKWVSGSGGSGVLP